MPTLVVQIPGKPEQSYVLRDEMTIGRAPDNDIVVDHCDVCSLHARVLEYSNAAPSRWAIETADDRFALVLDSRCAVAKVSLEGGSRFSIGEVQFTFSWDDPTPPLATAIPLRISCPRCHHAILHLPILARFCPHCGLELPAHCPPWPEGTSVDLSNPALIAYANALFNLGVRFENTPGGFDLEQALRYYQKAAKIGIPAAKARLDSR